MKNNAKKSYLDEIYDNLKSGYRYGKVRKDMRYPYFENNLYHFESRNGKELFGWNHFGSSAEKATKKDLKWILETIFGQSAKEFIQAHDKEIFIGIVAPLNDDGIQNAD